MILVSNFQVLDLQKIQSSESLKWPKITFSDRLNSPKFDFTKNLSGSEMIKLQLSQAFTSHFENFWSIVYCRICLLNWYWFQIQWMQNPQPLNSVLNSNIFGCNFNDRPQRCPRRTKKCSLKFRGDVRQWASCQSNTCPNRYPWVNNLSGN